MPIPDTQRRIRLIFIASVALVLAVLFLLSVTFREAEFRVLAAIGRFLSATSYRLQYAAAGFWAGAGSVHTASGEAVPVLLYHGIVDTPDRFSMTASTFKEQMFALKRAGYRTITVNEFIAFQRGEARLPDRSFLLTFDDGRRDSVEGADPILEALGFTAVMYVATDASLDQPDAHSSYYIDASDIGRMVSSGRWEIGSHAEQRGGGLVSIDASGTRDNFLSNRRWLEGPGRLESMDEYRARVDREVGTSADILTRALGTRPVSFSYPFGDYGQQSDTIDRDTARAVVRDVVASSYAVAFRQVWPLDAEYTYNYPADDPWRARRIEVGTEWSAAELLAYLGRGAPKGIPYADDLSHDAGWKYAWGAVSVADGTLQLMASSTTGGLAFLDGTGAWNGYYFSATPVDRRGYLSLVAAYRGEDSMISCTFGDAWVRITEERGGVTRTLIERTHLSSDTAIGIMVRGSSIACAEDGVIVAEATVRSPIGSGGIGFRIWDEQPDTAYARIDAVSVVPADEARILRAPDAAARTAATPPSGAVAAIPDTGTALSGAQGNAMPAPVAASETAATGSGIGERAAATTSPSEPGGRGVRERHDAELPERERQGRGIFDLLRGGDARPDTRIRSWLGRDRSDG